MRMLQSNFETALVIAIEAQKKIDQKSGVERSTFVAGLEEILKASRQGYEITIEST